MQEFPSKAYLCLRTDSPYLLRRSPSVCKRNSSLYLPYIAEAVARDQGD